ncbi:MAG: enoyl-CoA hydratase/isomerase family protein [Candidatus Binatus sp.]|uniref:enoyl-CoA hydratase/isomerase family protein n=1 Tax=Candidatus Binatus sp. TaxID=2811406 RepID=UPI0027259671|nr:enoyl-CoA hydratase/isomerase family protein [Candidatus Binatus sp.]MDO8433902.1 enoyl-CoA hydratase/isomerase family protein [Candidatus Binatus sp.]
MQHFKVEQHDNVQVWTMHNPPMNYMTGPMSRELLELIGKAEDDANTRAIILTGGIDGKFITHYSVDELAAMAADPAACAQSFPQLSEGFHRMLDRIMLMPKAVIAAINGDCMGGGYELALACDFRLAADGPYQIGLPESVLGILPGGGGTQRLPRLIGRGRALEVMLFGNVYHPRDALAMGMVNRMLPPETLMPFAMGWARTLAKRPPRSIAAIKRAVYLGADRDLESGLYIERMEMTQVMCSEDARIMMNAYNDAVARDPMIARSDFLNGHGVPAAKGR